MQSIVIDFLTATTNRCPEYFLNINVIAIDSKPIFTSHEIRREKSYKKLAFEN